ncbi:MAG TPA: flagellar motor protein MotB [Symbiobacteriaceae bacterium]|nr:flagellar motor protein MotB [Symbiobacteriaceae bacterium]
MSSKKKKGGGGHGGAGLERWLLTYSDMITLLLALFIMMYAMSKVDAGKYQAVAGALSKAFGGGGNVIVNTGLGVGDGMEIPIEKLPEMTPEQVQKALEQIGEGLAADFARDGRFGVYMNERGLVISLAGNAFFDSGKAELRPEIIPLLNDIAERLKGLPNDISLEGHTDSDPIHTAEFPSNWELSYARANRVRSYLQSRGVGEKQLIVVGYGETRPLYENTTPAGKQKNRRVDIVVLLTKAIITPGQEIKSSQP